MPPFAIRDARPQDQPALERIFSRASLSNAGDRAALLANPAFLALDAALIGRGRTRVASLPDDTVVGFASTSRVEDGALELDDLFVEPDWQRHGAARDLVLCICREATREQISRIDVTANTHAMAFYRALGFEGDGRVETTLGSGVRMHLDVR